MTVPEEKTLEEVIALVLEESERALKEPYEFKKPIKNVAVIGAGPSGLPSARHLRDAGLNVRVFERKSVVGGLWVYSGAAPLKPKIPSSRAKHEVESEVHDVPSEGREKTTVEMTPEIKKLLLTKCPPAPCYRDLKGNNPSRLFAIPGNTFPEGTPLFPSQQDNADFFQAYAEKFDLLPLIEFDTSVDLVTKNKQDNTWVICLSKYDVYPSGLVRISRWKETFDAVVSASGIHQKALIPDFKDLTAWNKMWPNKASHSNQYRRPEDFKNKNVLVIGGGISGCDVARSLDGFAKSVSLSIRGPFETPYYIFNLVRSAVPESVIIKPTITSFSNAEGNIDGSILFDDGSVMDDVDHVIFCTGYTNSLGYFGDLLTEKKPDEMNTEKVVNFEEIAEGEIVVSGCYPLNVYQEVFLISDPTLAFVGYPPYFAAPIHFDTQAHAVARVWSGNALLPTVEGMQKFTAEYDLGISPAEIYLADRRRKEHFSTWLNHHAKALRKGDGVELPEVENYPEYWEEFGMNALKSWAQMSTENFDDVKKRYL